MDAAAAAHIDRKGRLRLCGEIDGATSWVLAKQIAGWRGNLTIDCDGLTFLDSSGITVLMKAQQRLDAQGFVLKLENVPQAVARILALIGLSSVVNGATEPEWANGLP